MYQYLALTPNIPTDKNIIFHAEDFNDAKNILKSLIKKNTMYHEVTLIELHTLKTKNYFIEKM